MESKLMGAALTGALGASKDAAAGPTAANVQSFQALMQQPSPATASPSAGHFVPGDRYVDEVAAVSSAERGVSMSPEVAAVGKSLSEALQMAKVGPTKLSQMKVTDPHIAQLRDGMLDALKFQGSMVQLNLTMKSVELSAQGFQTLYKMQG